MPTDDTTVEQFVDALAMVESSGNPFAWGDDVLVDRPPQCSTERGSDPKKSRVPAAMGRWEVHADRLFDEADSFQLRPLVGEPYDSFVRRIVGAIAAMFVAPEGAVSTAMYWHLGHWSDPKSDDWDLNYATKFSAALDRVKGQS